MRQSLLLRGSASLIALAALTSIAHAQDAQGPGMNPTTGPTEMAEQPAEDANTVDLLWRSQYIYRL